MQLGFGCEVLASEALVAYSRKAWLKFYRQGIGWPDWREALATRSPDILKPGFVYYRLP